MGLCTELLQTTGHACSMAFFYFINDSLISANYFATLEGLVTYSVPRSRVLLNGVPLATRMEIWPVGGHSVDLFWDCVL